MPGKKGSSTGGAMTGGMGNLKGAIVGILTMVVGLIMIALAMTTISDMVNDPCITWADYPGAEDLWGMVPMMMGIGIIVFGVLLGWLGYGGKSIDIKTAISAPLVAIIMVLMAPMLIDFVDSVVNHTDIADFVGIDIFTMIPMLYAMGVILLPGVLGYLGVRKSF